MTKKLLIPAIWLLFFTSQIAMTAEQTKIDTLTYMTEEFAPYNYLDNNTLTGLSVELLKSIWAHLGYEEQPIKIYPWARAYQLIQNNDNHVLFSMTRTNEREKLFKWVGPIHVDKFVLISLKKRNITINSLQDIKRLRVGTTRNDVAEEIISELGIVVREEDRVPSMGINVKKLLLGRVDLVSYSERGFFNYLKNENYDTDEFTVVFVCKEVGSYFAFSPSIPDSLINQFQKAMDSLKFRHTQLINKYLK